MEGTRMLIGGRWCSAVEEARTEEVTSPFDGLSRRAQAATFADAARGVLAVVTGGLPAAVANPDWIKRRPVQIQEVRS